jgi:hypothetical protein
MASRIVNEKGNMAENTYEIEVSFDNYKDYEKTRNFICELNREKEEPTPPKCVSAQTEPPRKPQGMLLLAKSNDTMLDVARNVIKAVETTIEVPTGLRSLTVNKDEETRNRILELIEYLRVYTDWRE